jgi:hypothetical protein
MPLDPDRLREAGEKAQSLSKRMDSFLERCKINDSAEDEDEDEEIEEELLDPTEEAMRATPGSDLANPDLDEPWYATN